MTMTFKFSTAGAQMFMEIPGARHNPEWYQTEAGRLDVAKVVQEFRDKSGIQFSADDDASTMAMMIEFLHRVQTSLRRLAKEDPDFNEKDANERATSSERRMRRGKFSSVRMRITAAEGGYCVKMFLTNPHGAVGESDAFARAMAQAFADQWVAIEADSRDLKIAYRFVEGEGCTGVFAAARKRIQNEAKEKDEDQVKANG